MIEGEAVVTDRIENMRASRHADAVILQEYNSYRSKRPDVNIFAVEGHDDVVFYEVMASRCGVESAREYFICNGKEKVLGLRRMLKRNLSTSANNVYFFVDRDFDDLKGEEPSKNLHCTDVYSIENYLTCTKTLDTLLKAEFRCAAEADNENQERARRFYEGAITSFNFAMREANLCLFLLRTNGIYSKTVENNLDKFLKISESEIKSITSTTEAIALIGGDGHLTENDLIELSAELKEKFDNLNPQKRWRGKYNLQFFCKILKILKEDRGRKNPLIFKDRKRMDAEFSGNMTRVLSSACPIPDSLLIFYQSIKTPSQL